MTTEPHSLMQRITEAREILGLGEEATLSEIDARVKRLLKRWHPDVNVGDVEQSTVMTRRILEATETIRAYCAHYRYSFRAEEVEKYLSPAEWMERRFGGKPYWASGTEFAIDADHRRKVTGKRKR
ncbi:MAG: J domain-containing protein [Magnetococcales bacterium]|nr:J domain-containing protein [Magnetococcales bacterium]